MQIQNLFYSPLRFDTSDIEIPLDDELAPNNKKSSHYKYAVCNPNPLSEVRKLILLEEPLNDTLEKIYEVFKNNLKELTNSIEHVCFFANYEKKIKIWSFIFNKHLAPSLSSTLPDLDCYLARLAATGAVPPASLERILEYNQKCPSNAHFSLFIIKELSKLSNKFNLLIKEIILHNNQEILGHEYKDFIDNQIYKNITVDFSIGWLHLLDHYKLLDFPQLMKLTTHLRNLKYDEMAGGKTCINLHYFFKFTKRLLENSCDQLINTNEENIAWLISTFAVFKMKLEIFQLLKILVRDHKELIKYCLYNLFKDDYETNLTFFFLHQFTQQYLDPTSLDLLNSFKEVISEKKLLQIKKNIIKYCFETKRTECFEQFYELIADQIQVLQDLEGYLSGSSDDQNFIFLCALGEIFFKKNQEKLTLKCLNAIINRFDKKTIKEKNIQQLIDIIFDSQLNFENKIKNYIFLNCFYHICEIISYFCLENYYKKILLFYNNFFYSLDQDLTKKKAFVKQIIENINPQMQFFAHELLKNIITTNNEENFFIVEDVLNTTRIFNKTSQINFKLAISAQRLQNSLKNDKIKVEQIIDQVNNYLVYFKNFEESFHPNEVEKQIAIVTKLIFNLITCYGKFYLFDTFICKLSTKIRYKKRLNNRFLQTVHEIAEQKNLSDIVRKKINLILQNIRNFKK